MLRLALLLLAFAGPAFAQTNVIGGAVSGDAKAAGGPCTATSITLSNNTFTGGSASGTVVGAISINATGCTLTSSLSIGGTDAASFQLSSTSLPSNLETNGVVGIGSYSISLTVTNGSAVNSPFTQTPVAVTGLSNYTGPGDVFSGASVWIGLRAYNAAYATGSNNAFDYQSGSGLGGTHTGVILNTGDFDIATANSNVGTDATANCVIASTTATCTGGSSVPHIGSTISGTGVTQPCYTTAAGTGTAAAFTVAIQGLPSSNPCGAVGSSTAMTFQYGIFATKPYDQSGNGVSFSTQTGSARMQIFPVCQNGKPCWSSNLASSTFFAATVGAISAAYGEFSGQRNSTGAPNFATFLSTYNGSTAFYQFLATGSSNQVELVGSGSASSGVTMSDGTFHAAQGMLGASSTGIINIDGTETTVSTGAAGASTKITIMADLGPINAVIGVMGEAGFWPATPSSGQRTSIRSNIKTYWNTP